MTASSWAWVYKYGMRGSLSGTEDARRKWFGIEAIKAALVELGHVDINLDTGQFGGKTRTAVKDFQQQETDAGHAIGGVDGVVGKKTANALFRNLYEITQNLRGVPNNWLRAHCHWESGDDPGAELVNSDMSRDRGLTQSNDEHAGILLTDEQAFDPFTALEVRASSIATWERVFQRKTVEVLAPDGKQHTYDSWAMAVSAHRTPVGAKGLAAATSVVTAKRVQDGGTWTEAAAYYCWIVDLDYTEWDSGEVDEDGDPIMIEKSGGRSGWVG